MLYALYSFLFLLGESAIDGIYSRILSSLDKVTGFSEWYNQGDVQDKIFIAKIVKTLLIAGALLLYSSWEFTIIYIISRIIYFDLLLSLVRFGGFKGLSWYMENHIIVRAIQFIKRRF